MKKYSILFLTLLLLIFTAATVEAQSKTKRSSASTAKSKKKTKEPFDLKKHLNPELYIGNLGFFNGLYISSKANVGYKFNDRFSAGLGAKIFYNQIAVQGDDPSLFDKGGFIFARGKITDNIFAQVEYNSTNFADRTVEFNSPLIGGTFNYPTFGLGYSSGQGPWTYNATLFYVSSSDVQDYTSNILEYWVGVSYNF